MHRGRFANATAFIGSNLANQSGKVMLWNKLEISRKRGAYFGTGCSYRFKLCRIMQLDVGWLGHRFVLNPWLGYQPGPTVRFCHQEVVHLDVLDICGERAVVLRVNCPVAHSRILGFIKKSNIFCPRSVDFGWR